MPNPIDRPADLCSRFAPLTDAEWPPALADLKDGFAGALNVYRVMARHPALLRAWTALRAHVVEHSALTPEQSEVVILRTGHHLNSSYEWAQHVVRARARGMSDARITAMRGALCDMARDDAILAGAVDDLMTEKRLTPETAARVESHLGAEGLLDLMATVGFYTTLGFLLNSFDTPLDAEIAQDLAARPLAP